MLKKETGFFEEHIEKIVLIAAGAVSMWLLVAFVILGSGKITYNNKTFSPSQIDKYILDGKANLLEVKLKEPPARGREYFTKQNDFDGLMAKSFNVDKSASLVLPDNLEQVGIQPKYALPQITPVTDPVAEHIRTVAYVPVVTINEKNAYSRTNSEPNDIDMVTVEARIDVAALYKNFNDCFNGTGVKEQWRDKNLAEPVFAAVGLQRCEQLPDGSWSSWQDVLRSKIDSYRELFKIIENVNELPAGGLPVRLMEYKEKDAQINLLQPDIYRIAVSKEEWYPPSLHIKYRSIVEEKERRQKIESLKAEQERKKTAAANPRPPLPKTPASKTPASKTPASKTPAQLTAAELLAKAYSGGTGYLSQPVADSDTEDNAAIDELNKSFDKVLLTDKSDLSKIISPLLVWTLDDTVESSKTYRYRIRLGVFNPIAGTDKFVDENNPLRNKVILWTDFAEAPQTVEIPGRIHFFAKDIEEQAHRVTVTVCRYVLGNWYHYDFKVRPGETIGSAEKTVQPADETPNPLGKAYRTLGSESLTPKDVNYSTGATVVDTVPVSDYGGSTNLYKRDFFEMFYSYRGDDLDRMPIGSKVWSVDKQRLYDNIKKLESQPKDTLRQWSEGKTGASQRTTEQQPGIPMGGMPTDRESYRQMMKSGTLGPK